jgi:ubiquinone/menaquinone biosynthesis C-methylase UbiE
VAPIVGDSFSTEDARDRVGEAEAVIAFAGVAPGMSVADIGAGEGYYTVRLSRVVGPRGRVLAEDIVPSTRDRLALRVQREGLDNIAVRLGLPQDPKLPAASFDRIFLVHMYHEVDRPYEFLWNLREGLKEGGLVIVVDADRPVKRHGTPPRLLICEFAAIGLQPVTTSRLPGSDAYFASFKVVGVRPHPSRIKPCDPTAFGRGR